jgi:poly-gamma-glutamate synthesis protein (capsule biosynthesis protein)
MWGPFPRLTVSLLLLLLNLLQTVPASAVPFRLTFVGDIMLDGGPGHLVTNGIDPFADVSTYLTDSDLTIGNLECAITRKGHAQDKPYTFKGPRQSLPFLKKYFSAVSLANNHAADWGAAGFGDELTLLSETGLPWFGGGATEPKARAPLVLEVKGRKVALLGYNEFPPRSFAATSTKPGTAWLIEKNVVADIRRTRNEHSPNLVILYLHWGEELEPLPRDDQVALAHRLIDAGADAVIGSHPHVTQTIEFYRDKPIVYSLGNFLFDYFPTDPLVWTGYILRLDYNDGLVPKLSSVPIELDPAGVPHLLKGRSSVCATDKPNLAAKEY